ncbi:tetratricopeptide repeat protein [Dysgonomonas sp. 25]|uniref:tetratricopeptide repeat protein n=1 Tax=Dysgonomonas sp. 25 TaxID=2302933 RepID=UPI0013D1E136|nr:tetratricopeptide repeat protein [Dysgonomonas sp. 25]NDV68181.1 tetratricopeptide repeat protein [Dysgonomonas sp. 25]
MKKIILSCLLIFIYSATIYAQATSEKLIREGASLHDRGRYSEAIERYQEALKMNPESKSALYEMSLSYLGLKNYPKAIEYSSKVIDVNFEPLLPDAYIVKSTALAQTNKMDESIQLLNEALEKCGDTYLLHFNLGLSYFNKRDNKMAIDHLQKAIEIDATHASAFLMYAYALSDSDKWIKSIYAFHFFLLLEPNTERSKEAFAEMYDLLSADIPADSPKMQPEDGVNRQLIYQNIRAKRPDADDAVAQYKFFEEASNLIFFTVGQLQNDKKSGLLWNFFVPVYDEILESGYFDVYCRYVSVAHFPESLLWWENNKDKVDNFIEWFEKGQGASESELELGEEEIDAE